MGQDTPVNNGFGSQYSFNPQRGQMTAYQQMEDPTADTMKSTAMAGAQGGAMGGPWGAAVAAGSTLITKILQANEEREKIRMQNDVAKQQNYANALSGGYNNQASIMQNFVQNLSKGLVA